MEPDRLSYFKQKERSFLFPTLGCGSLYLRLSSKQAYFTPTLPMAEIRSMFSLAQLSSE